MADDEVGAFEYLVVNVSWPTAVDGLVVMPRISVGCTQGDAWVDDGRLAPAVQHEGLHTVSHKFKRPRPSAATERLDDLSSTEAPGWIVGPGSGTLGPFPAV